MIVHPDTYGAWEKQKFSEVKQKTTKVTSVKAPGPLGLSNGPPKRI